MKTDPGLSEIAYLKRVPERHKSLDGRVLRIGRKTLATFAKQTPGEQFPGVFASPGLLEVKTRS